MSRWIRIALRMVALPLMAALSACAPDAPQSAPPALVLPAVEDAAPWTGAALQDDADDFHFVVVSDRTCCARRGVFAQAMPKVNLLSPAFVVSVGDLIEGYTQNQAQLELEWDEIESYTAQLDAPFFYAAGNHDMNNAVMAEEWRRRFGPSYYHFQYKDVLFLVLNSELFGMVGALDTPVPGPFVQEEQMAFVRSVLAQHPSPRWTIVLLHQPLWTHREIDADWLEVESLLADRPYTVFAGHEHQYSHVVRNDRNFITLATTGGGSALRGPAFGEFDHVAWVTMREDGPVIGNVLLDGILDIDVSNPALQDALRGVAEQLVLRAPPPADGLFSSAVVEVTITNPTSAPMTVSPSVARRGNFQIEGLAPLTVPPGETRAQMLRLSVEQPKPFHELQTAAVQWVVTGTMLDRPLQFPVTKPLLPLGRHAIGRADSIAVDGKLKEWGELRFAARRQGDILSPDLDPADASYRFDVREGADHLFVAIDVTDDDVQVLPDLIPRSQDSVLLFIDPRPAPQRNRPMSAGEAALGGDMAAQVATIVPTGDALTDELLGFVQETNEAIDYQVQRTESGYVAEFAIPLALIGEKAATAGVPDGEWREARVSIGIYDLDAGDHAPTPLFWQPYRYGNAALPGTELFVRP